MVVWLLASRKAETGKGRMVLKVGEKGWNVMPAAVAVVVVAGVGLVGREIGREILGERYMKKSIVAAGKNDAKGTYDWQIRAITMNPTMADYRKVYAQTNLSIAQGLLSAPELSDEQKQQAAMLVQQAVREGKTAVNLEPLEPKYWLNLAEIYRGLIGLVDGAAEWSYQAYAQAVGLDGVNPLARLQLGGLLYSAGRWEEADRVFELVVSTKGDFANGWYNWAYSAKQLKKLPEAIQRLGQALSLVPVDSADYDKASQELGEWKKELEEINKKLAVTPTPTGKAGVLKTAEPLPTGAKEKVEVPKTGLEPPAGEATPTP
jgi:tetratricopeptide (TPR) repeat protein